LSLATTVVTLVILLALTEITIRIYTQQTLIYDVEMSRYATEIKLTSPNPLIGHVHAPVAEAMLMGVRVKTNSDGLRDREYPVARNSRNRIIFLGDSLTFGWGVEKSKTFEEILESEMSRGTPTEIINFGTGNYNTEQEVNLFLERGRKYRPDAVVMFYFINDAEPTPRQSRWELLGWSRAVTFLWSRVHALMAGFGLQASFRDYYANLYVGERPGWIAAKNAFLQLREVCAKDQIALRVVLLPEFHVLQNYPFAAEHREILAFLRESRIDALDLAPLFAHEERPSRLWVATDDAHPNELAHALIAEYSLDFIVGASHGRAASGAD
jgi:lysophospholipase L1-like esterase